MNNSALDAAILAYRENPTPQNHAKVMAAAQAHTDAFHARQTADFQQRTR